MEYQYADEGNYCPECDSTFSEEPVTILLSEWVETYACPRCGHVDTLWVFTEYFFEFAFYLMNLGDEEYAWPYPQPQLPPYEG